MIRIGAVTRRLYNNRPPATQSAAATKAVADRSAGHVSGRPSCGTHRERQDQSRLLAFPANCRHASPVASQEEYWSIDVPGPSESQAEELVAHAQTHQGLHGTTLNPAYWYTRSLDKNTVGGFVRAIESVDAEDREDVPQRDFCAT